MEKLFRMTIQLFMKYKKHHNTVPCCVSCGTHILVNEIIEPVCRRGNHRRTKYLCVNCSKKPLVVYQIIRYGRKGMGVSGKNPLGKIKKDDDYIHEIATYTSQ